MVCQLVLGMCKRRLKTSRLMIAGQCQTAAEGESQGARFSQADTADVVYKWWYLTGDSACHKMPLTFVVSDGMFTCAACGDCDGPRAPATGALPFRGLAAG